MNTPALWMALMAFLMAIVAGIFRKEMPMAIFVATTLVCVAIAGIPEKK